MHFSRSFASAALPQSASAARMVASSAARVSGGAAGCCWPHAVAKHAMKAAANNNERFRDIGKPPVSRVRAEGKMTRWGCGVKGCACCLRLSTRQSCAKRRLTALLIVGVGVRGDFPRAVSLLFPDEDELARFGGGLSLGVGDGVGKAAALESEIAGCCDVNNHAAGGGL